MTITNPTGLFAGILLMLVASAEAGPRIEGTLVDVVRHATEAFQDVANAEAASYAAMPSCVSGPEEGAMGIHYVNGTLVSDDEVQADRPEALIYEARNGTLVLVGVEYIVFADAWSATHAGTPVLLGQQFHYVGSPNRYGLPAFYELHVWAWRDNPSGTFADWNPKVSCDEFTTAETAGHAFAH